MPIVNTSILVGRTLEAKSGFAKAITAAAVEHLGVKPEQVRVILTEIPHQHWFTAGESKVPAWPGA